MVAARGGAACQLEEELQCSDDSYQVRFRSRCLNKFFIKVLKNASLECLFLLKKHKHFEVCSCLAGGGLKQIGRPDLFSTQK